MQRLEFQHDADAGIQEGQFAQPVLERVIVELDHGERLGRREERHLGAAAALIGAGDLVRALKENDGKDICVMGGGLLAKSLFEAGVIDEVGFNIHPILLGSGIPSFHRMTSEVRLELADCKPMKNGCVYVLYNVIN